MHSLGQSERSWNILRLRPKSPGSITLYAALRRSVKSHGGENIYGGYDSIKSCGVHGKRN